MTTALTRTGIALAAAAVASLPVAFASPAFAAPAATEKIVVQPFAADGTLEPGWTVKNMDQKLDCHDDWASPGGVTADTHWCGGTVHAAYACVADPIKTGDMLCYIGGDNLLRYHTKNLGSTKKPAEPLPLQIEFTNGDRCQLHVGGAWPSTPEGTYPAYGCWGDGGEDAFVTGDQDTQDIFDTSSNAWTVRFVGARQADGTYQIDRRQTVAKVWYVGAPQAAPVTTSVKPQGAATSAATKDAATTAPKKSATRTPSASPTKTAATGPARGVPAKTGVEGGEPLVLLGVAAVGAGILAGIRRPR